MRRSRIVREVVESIVKWLDSRGELVAQSAVWAYVGTVGYWLWKTGFFVFVVRVVAEALPAVIALIKVVVVLSLVSSALLCLVLAYGQVIRPWLCRQWGEEKPDEA